jgi:hypothetical protein
MILQSFLIISKLWQVRRGDDFTESSYNFLTVEKIQSNPLECHLKMHQLILTDIRLNYFTHPSFALSLKVLIMNFHLLP